MSERLKEMGSLNVDLLRVQTDTTSDLEKVRDQFSHAQKMFKSELEVSQSESKRLADIAQKLLLDLKEKSAHTNNLSEELVTMKTELDEWQAEMQGMIKTLSDLQRTLDNTQCVADHESGAAQTSLSDLNEKATELRKTRSELD